MGKGSQLQCAENYIISVSSTLNVINLMEQRGELSTLLFIQQWNRKGDHLKMHSNEMVKERKKQREREREGGKRAEC